MKTKTLSMMMGVAWGACLLLSGCKHTPPPPAAYVVPSPSQRLVVVKDTVEEAKSEIDAEAIEVQRRIDEAEQHLAMQARAVEGVESAAGKARMAAERIKQKEWLRQMMVELHVVRAALADAVEIDRKVETAWKEVERLHAYIGVRRGYAGEDLQRSRDAIRAVEDVLSRYEQHVAVASESIQKAIAAGSEDFDAEKAEEELKQLTERRRSLEKERDRLVGVATAVESQYQKIAENTAAKQLDRAIRTMERSRKLVEEIEANVRACELAIIEKPEISTVFEPVRVADLAEWLQNPEDVKVLNNKHVRLVGYARTIEPGKPNAKDHYEIVGLSGGVVPSKFSSQGRPLPNDIVFLLAVIQARPDGQVAVLDDVMRYYVAKPGKDTGENSVPPTEFQLQKWVSYEHEFALENCLRGFISSPGKRLPYLTYGEWEDAAHPRRTTVTELQELLGEAFSIPPAR